MLCAIILQVVELFEHQQSVHKSNRPGSLTSNFNCKATQILPQAPLREKHCLAKHNQWMLLIKAR